MNADSNRDSAEALFSIIIRSFWSLDLLTVINHTGVQGLISKSMIFRGRNIRPAHILQNECYIVVPVIRPDSLASTWVTPQDRPTIQDPYHLPSHSPHNEMLAYKTGRTKATAVYANKYVRNMVC